MLFVQLYYLFIVAITFCQLANSQINDVGIRACERSGKRSGATRKSGGAERSGERAWEKNDGAERSVEREVACHDTNIHPSTHTRKC